MAMRVATTWPMTSCSGLSRKAVSLRFTRPFAPSRSYLRGHRQPMAQTAVRPPRATVATRAARASTDADELKTPSSLARPRSERHHDPGAGDDPARGRLLRVLAGIALPDFGVHQGVGVGDVRLSLRTDGEVSWGSAQGRPAWHPRLLVGPVGADRYAPAPRPSAMPSRVRKRAGEPNAPRISSSTARLPPRATAQLELAHQARAAPQHLGRD